LPRSLSSYCTGANVGPRRSAQSIVAIVSCLTAVLCPLMLAQSIVPAKAAVRNGRIQAPKASPQTVRSGE
jgi:hypothetical protein